MLYPDLTDIPIEVFGGYCPAVPPSDLAPGAANVAQDVVFPQGAVRTRGGLGTNVFAGGLIPANASINGLKSFLTSSLAQRLMAWDSLGNLYKESPQGTLGLVGARGNIGAGLLYQSQTLFGREYQAFFNSAGGFDIPRQFDDTNWDRVSQGGCEAGLLSAADSVAAGNIGAGVHNVAVAFITRQGYITRPSMVTVSWTAGGSKQVTLTNIPTGPANIVGRLLLFTPVITAPAVTGSFYSLPNGSKQLVTPTVMQINDNTTTTATVDFTDAILIAGFQANYLFTQVTLGETACVLPYSSRLVWFGERNKVPNFLNLDFEGGFTLTGFPVNTQPNGWNGSADAKNTSAAGDWGSAYVIVGDGATAKVGQIEQIASVDTLGVAKIQPNTSYRVRVRLAKAGGLVQGALHVDMAWASDANNTVGLVVQAAQLTAAFQEFDALLYPATKPIPSDLNLRVYADGTPTNGGQFIIDSIEVYPANTPFNYSVARVSHAFNPESYDATTGQIQVRPGDGQQLRSGFPLRNNLYLAKDHYLCYVSDDGVNEPASWQVNEVSATIGICGPNAVDWTEEWAVFAERSGLYICWGSDPVKLTPEIQNDASGTNRISWASINWQYGHTIWVRIDKTNKMILVGAPVNGATSPNIVFMLDYRWLESAQDIASSPLITYSAFTGKMLAHGRGRRWAIWNITANSMCFAERSDGTSQPLFGNGTANGKIYQQQDVTINGADDGVAIPSIYQTYGTPSHMEEQQYQMGSHRKLFGYLKFRAVGSGLLSLAISTTARSTLLRSYTLSTSPAGDGERPCNVHAERFFINVSTNTVNTWFQLEKLIACVKRDASIPVRGVSS